MPSPIDPPPACRFHTRCPWATERLLDGRAALADYGDGRGSRRAITPATSRGSRSPAAEIVPESPQSASKELPKAEEAPA